ncbi:MAG: hypothetical protein KDB50_13385 [Mycobacterium sp.]|nr:hypothetical protein [Mycobacterium sp.]
MSDLDGDGVDHSGSATATNIARNAGLITAEEFNAAIAANTGLDHALGSSADIAGPGCGGPATKGDQGGARMAFSFELLDDATSRNPGSVWADARSARD